MTPTERQNYIMEIIKKRKVIATKELEGLLYCSNSTLRRDLIELEEQGKISRGQGEVTLNSPKNTDYAYDARLVDEERGKKKIAEIAATFIGPSQSIFLDSSTTVSYILPYLKNINNLQIITNSVYLPASLNKFPNVSLFVAGGQVTYQTKSILGNFTVDFIDNFQTDVTFFSCKGIDHIGSYEADGNQALIKQKMIQNTHTKVLLVDSSKFNKTHFFKLAQFKDIDYIITNKKPDKKFLNSVSPYSEVLYPDD